MTPKRTMQLVRWQEDWAWEFLVTARCGHRWMTAIPSPHIYRDLCLSLERLLDRHEDMCWDNGAKRRSST